MSDTFDLEVPPRRLADTRHEGDGKLSADQIVSVTVEPGALGAQVTVTAVDPEEAGFVTVWQGGPRPDTSCLNFVPGVNFANTTAVPLAGSGEFFVYVSGRTHILVDLVGTYR